MMLVDASLWLCYVLAVRRAGICQGGFFCCSLSAALCVCVFVWFNLDVCLTQPLTICIYTRFFLGASHTRFRSVGCMHFFFASTATPLLPPLHL